MLKQESRLTLSSVVSVLASVVTFGGYVLVVGAIVAWVDVRAIKVPAIGVVADMPRNELFGRGLETLAVWLILCLILAVAVIVIGLKVPKDPRRPLIALAGSAAIGVALAAICHIDLWALKAILAISVIALWALGIRRMGTGGEPIPIAIACALGVGLGVGFELLLIDTGKASGFFAAAVALVVVEWLAGEMLYRRLGAPEGYRFIREPGPDPHIEYKTKRDARLRRSRWRSTMAIVVLAIALAVGAIASRRSYDFWVARVTMTNGTCASGTLLVRNSDEVLLAELERKDAAGDQVKNGFVEIPQSMISSVQVIGPPSAPRVVEAENCAKAAAKTPVRAFAPYSLTGESSAPEADPPVRVVPGPPGPEGERGTEGKPGPEGKPGQEGERGAEGKPGPEGERGVEGNPGPEGKTGSKGERGATGKTGARGERGPRGKRGERGVTGPTGPSGFDGS